jgi:hypothetical protein
MLLRVTPRVLALLFLALFTATALYSLWLWQPERQALKHQQSLLKAASNRNWKKVAALIGEEYKDQWGFDKKSAIREGREILRQFFVLEIQGETVAIEAGKNTIAILQRLTVDGKGTVVAEMVKGEVNKLRQPFHFEWKRQSWKPWDWQLVRTDNVELRIRAGEIF